VTSPPAGPGRPAIIALSAPATVDDAGRPIGEVAALFEEWLDDRRGSGRLTSQRTIDGYRNDMSRWATLLAQPGPGPALDRWKLRDVSAAALRAALAEMADAGLSVSARQRAMAPLRGFCGWLTLNRRLPTDPTRDQQLTVTTAPSQPAAAFTDNELERITAAVTDGAGEQRDTSRWPERDLAALILLAGCGLRTSELCALTWADLRNLDGNNPTVHISGNGARERSVPLPPHSAAALRSYRDDRRHVHRSAPLAVQPDTRVIIRGDGKPVTLSTLTVWVTRWLNAAGVARRPGALIHAFRRTAADGWLTNGATLTEVQALLGHASVATTATYTTSRTEPIVSAAKSGPLEKLLGRPAPTTN
jgi:site-specific recombinase XerD